MSLRLRGSDTGIEAVRVGDVVTLHGTPEPTAYDVVHVAGPCWILRRDGVQHVAHAVQDRGVLWVHVDGRTHVLDRAARRGATAEADGSLLAPMTGRIVEVAVAEGARVESGAVLVVLSAMKMRVEIKAPFAGVVARLPVREGEQVEGGALLAVVERELAVVERELAVVERDPA